MLPCSCNLSFCTAAPHSMHRSSCSLACARTAGPAPLISTDHESTHSKILHPEDTERPGAETRRGGAGGWFTLMLACIWGFSMLLYNWGVSKKALFYRKDGEQVPCPAACMLLI